ncbi:hypothetical protein ACWGLG_16420 [Streptomyces antimycoticus]
MAKLSSKRRKQLPKTSFALPGKRKYPVDTKNRARNALARVSQHGTKSEQKAVRSKVAKRYPSIGKTGRRKKGGK